MEVLRTPAEIAFRVRQELANIRLWARPPRREFDPKYWPHFPAPDASELARTLAGSEFAREAVDLAYQIRQHRFPLLGLTIDTGPEIRWRRDYLRGIETGLDYFRRIPYLDAARAGDHKLIWELNRHQHLVTLAQAYLFTGDSANLDDIRAQLASWIVQNPFGRGINWASALEVAFRSLSWIWVYHFVGPELPSGFRAAWLDRLHQHGSFIANNLSHYFSPNTHLLGEALALHALGLLFANGRWQRTGDRIMRREMERQVHADGSHVEQSSYYHVYALDMFLHARRAEQARSGVSREARRAWPNTSTLCSDQAAGFRFSATTTAVVWLIHSVTATNAVLDNKLQSRLFPDAGIAAMVSGENQIIVDAGPFGPWRSGHSHADTLSIVARSGDDEILIDPGTYTYCGPERDWFRGTGAHNTIRIDGLDQAAAAGPFAWRNPPQVQILSWTTSSQLDVLDAECRYFGFIHRRRVEFQKPDALLVTDDILGPPGEHDVEQLWHLGSLDARERLIAGRLDAELLDSWRSRTFGEKHPAPLLRVHRRSQLAAAVGSPHPAQSLIKCSTTLRRCGRARCSNRYTPCQVPSASLPLCTGIESCVAVSADRMCDVMSSGPSAVCR